MIEKLEIHFQNSREPRISELFEKDLNRLEKYSITLNSVDDHFLLFDYSKNILDDLTLSMLLALAKEKNVFNKIQNMFNGEKINTTENRAVLHIALRNRSNRPIFVDGEDVMPKVNAVLEKMRVFIHRVRSGEWKGYTGKPIHDVINIGIGGSDLGPQMVTLALTPYGNPNHIRAHYISNVDGTHAAEVFKIIDPETCLFIVASKTFTTLETMTNAFTCKTWWLTRVGEGNKDNVKKHFVAVSTNLKGVSDFGIDPNNAFPFWDWVGGRLSLWSAIGLSTALYIGYDNFIELLAGAHDMDEHTRSEDNLSRNIPVIQGLLNVWYANFYHSGSRVILPYDQYLSRLPAFLQQLEMESNGKNVLIDGQPVGKWGTGPVVWGEAGTNGQHAFYQLIHQGTRMIPCDFIFPLRTHNELGEHHSLLASNVFAQAEALMKGKTFQQAYAELSRITDENSRVMLAHHKTFPGNRPSTMIIVDKITPRTLGMIIALYEHKVYVEGVIWGINSFDQWGVELGKTLASEIFPLLKQKDELEEDQMRDVSTQNLIDLFRKWNPPNEEERKKVLEKEKVKEREREKEREKKDSWTEDEMLVEKSK